MLKKYWAAGWRSTRSAEWLVVRAESKTVERDRLFWPGPYRTWVVAGTSVVQVTVAPLPSESFQTRTPETCGAARVVVVAVDVAVDVDVLFVDVAVVVPVDDAVWAKAIAANPDRASDAPARNAAARAAFVMCFVSAVFIMSIRLVRS
jgi:hypothetical protein